METSAISLCAIADRASHHRAVLSGLLRRLPRSGSSATGLVGPGRLLCGGTQLDFVDKIQNVPALTRDRLEVRTPHGLNADFTRPGMKKPQAKGHEKGK